MKSILFRVVRTLLLTYVVICLLVAMFQRRIMYHPTHYDEIVRQVDASEKGFVPWRNTQGAIIGWKTRSDDKAAANRLLVFHGNAGDALQRNQFPDLFEPLGNGHLWKVYLFEYPGYGTRPGSLGQSSFTRAGLEALQGLRAGDSRPVYLVGESLGSGPACALAQSQPKDVAGLLLVTPHARMLDLAKRRFGFLPVSLLLRDPWDNVMALRDYRGPLAMLIAGEDEVVTPEQGQLLFDSYAGPKHLWSQPTAGHNNLNFNPKGAWWKQVSDFLLKESGTAH